MLTVMINSVSASARITILNSDVLVCCAVCRILCPVRLGQVLAAVNGRAHPDRRSPYLWDESHQAFFGKSAFSAFRPFWLKKYVCETGDRNVFYEPPGHDWVNEHKLKRIQTRLYEAFGSIDAAMERIDQVILVLLVLVGILYLKKCQPAFRSTRTAQGCIFVVLHPFFLCRSPAHGWQDLSGTVEVHELVEALRDLKIWLNANQLQALLKAVDPDASGTISMEEFKHFWLAYAGEWQLSQDTQNLLSAEATRRASPS